MPPIPGIGPLRSSTTSVNLAVKESKSTLKNGRLPAQIPVTVRTHETPPSPRPSSEAKSKIVKVEPLVVRVELKLLLCQAGMPGRKNGRFCKEAHDRFRAKKVQRSRAQALAQPTRKGAERQWPLHPAPRDFLWTAAQLKNEARSAQMSGNRTRNFPIYPEASCNNRAGLFSRGGLRVVIRGVVIALAAGSA
jgi:hypothetical protein